MAKQVYEIKKSTKILGTLNKEDGQFFVEVESKNGNTYNAYPLEDILDGLVGKEISITSDDYLMSSEG